MTPGLAALLDRLTSRKEALLAELDDALSDLASLLLSALGKKKATEMREDIEYASEVMGELTELIADLRRELERLDQ